MFCFDFHRHAYVPRREVVPFRERRGHAAVFDEPIPRWCSPFYYDTEAFPYTTDVGVGNEE